MSHKPELPYSASYAHRLLISYARRDSASKKAINSFSLERSVSQVRLYVNLTWLTPTKRQQFNYFVNLALPEGAELNA